jgi:hypothetical protein
MACPYILVVPSGLESELSYSFGIDLIDIKINLTLAPHGSNFVI